MLLSSDAFLHIPAVTRRPPPTPPWAFVEFGSLSETAPPPFLPKKKKILRIAPPLEMRSPRAPPGIKVSVTGSHPAEEGDKPQLRGGRTILPRSAVRPLQVKNDQLDLQNPFWSYIFVCKISSARQIWSQKVSTISLHQQHPHLPSLLFFLCSSPRGVLCTSALTTPEVEKSETFFLIKTSGDKQRKDEDPPNHIYSEVDCGSFLFLIPDSDGWTLIHLYLLYSCFHWPKTGQNPVSSCRPNIHMFFTSTADQNSV